MINITKKIYKKLHSLKAIQYLNQSLLITPKFIKNQAQKFHFQIKDQYKPSVSSVSRYFNYILASDASIQIDRYLRSTFDSASTVYDRSMDYTRQLSGEFGGDHRLFDGGHGILGAWEAVKSALPDDTKSQEVIGYLSAYWKDLVTPMGMPIMTLDRNNFEHVEKYASYLGIQESWLKDIVSFTASESIGGLLVLISSALQWNEKDEKEFYDFITTIGLTSIIAANPLCLVITVITLACQHHRKILQKKSNAKISGVLRGGAKTTAFVSTAAIIGGPVWMGIVCGIIASMLTHKAFEKHFKEKKEFEFSEKSEELLLMLQSKIQPKISYLE